MNSPIASLETRADTASATAGAATSVATGVTLNGQWLYDRFIANDEKEKSRMDVVRNIIGQFDIATIKAALKDMVAIAKEKGPAQHKTALNSQTVMRNTIGVLRFAPDELQKRGLDPKNVGFNVMQSVAGKILKERGIKWDGTRVLSADVKEQKKATKEAQDAMTEVMRDNPQQIGESYSDWMARITPAVENRIEADRQEKHAAHIEALAKRFEEQAGDDLKAVVNLLLSRLMHEDEVTAEDEAE